MKPMIVEDRCAGAQDYQEFFGDLVDEFIECGAGNQALQTYSEHRPNLVLMIHRKFFVFNVLGSKNIYRFSRESRELS